MFKKRINLFSSNNIVLLFRVEKDVMKNIKEMALAPVKGGGH